MIILFDGNVRKTEMTTLDRIKVIAKKKGWSSLQSLALKAGIGANSIYRWDKQTPSTASLKKVAKVLHVSVNDLLGESSPAETVKRIDLADDIPLAYNGKAVPEKYLDIIRNLMDSDFKEGKKGGKFN